MFKKIKLTVLPLPEVKGSKHTLWPPVEVAQSICNVTHFQEREREREREEINEKRGNYH
jgi:hypothetical protein